MIFQSGWNLGLWTRLIDSTATGPVGRILLRQVLCIQALHLVTDHFSLPWQDVCWSLYVGRDFCVAEPIGAPMPHIDPKYDEMTWFHPPSKIAPQPNNLTETFEATCRLLMIARRIMDVMWVHGVDPSFSPLTRIFWLLAMGGTRLAVAHWILITWSMTLSMPFLLTTTYVVNLRTSTRLNIWKKSLSEDLEITPRSRLTATPHKLMLHLAYWWLVILLHRPFFRRKSRPIHSADSEIDHVKVSSIF